MTHRYRFAFAVACLLVLIGMTSCRHASMDGYRSTVKSGAKQLPYAVEMERTYGKADHFITHYGMSDSPLIWNTEVFVDGRLMLTMQVEVSIDYSTNRVTGVVGEPVFYVNEVSRITQSDSGQVSATFDTSAAAKFGKEEWASARDAGGDLSVVGVTAGPPVALFDVLEAQTRAPRIPVSLIDRKN
ncbi:MAG TPA: hypothetical protein VGN57_09125 [Pirellulaceae bacterium]|jgi:hypothetical protein|nr:hypothetical protein [Pirellulaceae bacterium]